MREIQSGDEGVYSLRPTLLGRLDRACRRSGAFSQSRLIFLAAVLVLSLASVL